MILIGADDDWNPAAYCRELVARPQMAVPSSISRSTSAPTMPSTTRNLAPGMRRFGHWLQYSEPPAADAWAKVLAFLTAHLSHPMTDKQRAR